MSDQTKEMMSEETILNGKFIFISYNHSDADIVTKDVVLLHEKSVRVWFDVNMHASDNWEEVAEEKIKHPNCVGVLFYNSPQSFLSKACEKERQMTWERRKNENGAFKYWFVNLNGTTNQMIGEASTRAQQESIDKLIAFSGYIANINEYFKEENIYIHPNAVVENMVKEAALVGAIDNNEQTLNILKKEGRISDERNILELGIFIDNKYLVPVEHNEQKAYERFTINNQKFICFNGDVYTTKPLHWELIDTKDGHAIFLCDRIVALCQGGQEAEAFLKHFVEVAFTEKQIAAFDRPARLLSLSDLKEDKELFSCNEKPFGDIHYWLSDKGLLDDWQMTAKDNLIYKKGFLITNKKGIRPVIEIPTDKLENFKKEH